MPLSLLGETQSLLAFEVKVVHNRLIVQWAWLNYGLQMVGTILVVVDEQGFLLDICGRPAGHWHWESTLSWGPSVDLDAALMKLCGAENRWDLKLSLGGVWRLIWSVYSVSEIPGPLFPLWSDASLLPPGWKFENGKFAWLLWQTKYWYPSSPKCPHLYSQNLWVWYLTWSKRTLGFPGGSVAKNMLANAGDMGLIPGLGRFSEERNGNPIQYSCLGNPVDRGAWRATVHEVTRVGCDLVTKQQQQKGLRVWLRTLRWII